MSIGNYWKWICFLVPGLYIGWCSRDSYISLKYFDTWIFEVSQLSNTGPNWKVSRNVTWQDSKQNIVPSSARRPWHQLDDLDANCIANSMLTAANSQRKDHELQRKSAFLLWKKRLFDILTSCSLQSIMHHPNISK